MTTVLLVDDHAMFREALVMALSHALPAMTVHAAASGQEALDILERHPDISRVVMDYYLPGLAGADLLQRLRQRRAPLHVLVLSASEDPEDERRAMAAGAHAFLNKSASWQQLAAALAAMDDALATPDGAPLPSHRVLRPADGAMATALPDKAQDEAARVRALSPDQRHVLRLMCQGLRNAEIADRLALTEAAVSLHVSAILDTLGVLNRTQATQVAQRTGLPEQPA